jgi:hypothetical protein
MLLLFRMVWVSQFCDWAVDWTIMVRFLAGAGIFSLHLFQTGFDVHSMSFPVGTKEWLECEADQSPLCSAKVKNVWRCTSIPLYIFHGMLLS